MPSPLLTTALLLAGATPASEVRLETLRHLARPAEERLVGGADGEHLRSQLVEMDRAFQALATDDGTRPVQSFRTLSSAAEVRACRAWVERARPVLAAWVRIESCDPVARDASSFTLDRMPLRQRIGLCWERGQRIANEPPRLPVLRRAANLIAWRASLDATKDPAEREPCEIAPAELVASIFTLAYAYDDSSLAGTMARIAIEEQALRAARLMLEQRTIPAVEMRAALEPFLARSAAFDPREMIEGELRSFLALYDRVASDGREALEYFANLREAFDLAQGSVTDSDGGAAGDDAFVESCRNALARVERHRSIVATFRVALGLLDRRERQGIFPTDLGELAAAFPDGAPADPLTGEPFAYRVEGGRAFLGPAACPLHGAGECRHTDWPAATEQMLAYELDAR